ncbi:ABC-type transport auxiliary lipoprotein family protein [Desertibaculum subflavum]|uniref:ABC-type transport auxiliary lipoprotein family protein n=1 Tax=Desertibaculum subflavum TaxID=2268458 RepID=UPI0013C4652A
MQPDRRFLLLAPLALGACSGIPGLGPPSNVYDLSPKSTFAPDLPTVEWQLIVEEPTASGGLDSPRIALKPNAYEVRYFAESRWTARAPVMVQTLMVESFENSKKIVAVGRETVGLRSDYNLKTDLREFQAEYIEDAMVPTIRVGIRARLVRQPRQDIVANRAFEAVVKAADANFSSALAAFDDALNKVLKGVVEWTLTSVPPERPGRRRGDGA